MITAIKGLHNFMKVFKLPIEGMKVTITLQNEQAARNFAFYAKRDIELYEQQVRVDETLLTSSGIPMSGTIMGIPYEITNG